MLPLWTIDSNRDTGRLWLELECLQRHIELIVYYFFSHSSEVPYSEVVITCDFESHIRSSNLRGATFF